MDVSSARLLGRKIQPRIEAPDTGHAFKFVERSRTHPLRARTDFSATLRPSNVNRCKRDACAPVIRTTTRKLTVSPRSRITANAVRLITTAEALVPHARRL